MSGLMNKKSRTGCFLFAATAFLISCNSVQYAVKKNAKYTDAMMLSLFEINGNAFYLGSTNATFSAVWTYKQDRVEIYKLAHGKVAENLISKENGMDTFDIPSEGELDKDLEDCGYELDGDVFGFMVKDKFSKRQDFPISIECLTHHTYQSSFLNEIVNTINKYKLWDVRKVD